MASPNFGFETTAEEVASAYTDQIKGKTILITGVSPNGLGEYTAKTLAQHSPALLILAARSQSALDATTTIIKDLAPNTPVKQLILDLAQIRTVRKAAAIVNSWTDVPKIDILINNAAVMATPFELSEDGIERQFATNHIGVFLFTNLIVPKIIAAKGRIVNVASAGHRFGPVRFDDWNFSEGKEYEPYVSYGQSKSANMLHAVSLAEKLGPKGVTAFSLHPGTIWTNLGRHVPREALVEKKLLKPDGSFNHDGPFKFKNHSQGSSTTLVAALNPNIVDRSGAYLSDCRVDHDDVMEAYALDKGNAERLWKLSERLVGEKFDFQ